eukprot:1139010-Pelagomonas_calceolata.AAC.7
MVRTVATGHRLGKMEVGLQHASYGPGDGVWVFASLVVCVPVGQGAECHCVPPCLACLLDGNWSALSSGLAMCYILHHA